MDWLLRSEGIVLFSSIALIGFLTYNKWKENNMPYQKKKDKTKGGKKK